MGVHPKYVKQNFFDACSKAMYYVYGAFCHGYLPSGEKGVLFRSSHKDLVQVVKEQLESDHAICEDPRDKSSYWIEMSNVPHMRSRLEELGLNDVKSERRFPRHIEPRYIDHFVRGFVEANAFLNVEERGSTLALHSGSNFLKELHAVFVRYANVRRIEQISTNILYWYRNTDRIYDFIYNDWEFIRSHRLYAPSQRSKFKHYTPIEDPKKARALRKIRLSVDLLRRRKFCPGFISSVAKQIGYKHQSGFSTAFKKYVGVNPSEFIGMNRHKAKRKH